MAKNKDCRNPHTAIMQDLVAAMQEWKLQGDHVVLGMEANEDIRHGEVHDLLDEAGPRKVILELHDDSSPPATQNRNQRREPIDGFWAASGINVNRGGHLAFGDACSSGHRLLWFEASCLVALGQRAPDMAPLQPKRLKAEDPRLTKKHDQSKMKKSGFKDRFDAFKLWSKIDWNRG
jgi:hypothetical protein